jgi:hypothetical protein
MSCVQNLSAFEREHSEHLSKNKCGNSHLALANLPEELLLRILGYLSIIELAKSCEVSKHMKRLAADEAVWNAFDLKKEFPSLKIFNETHWHAYADPSLDIDLSDLKPLNKKISIPLIKNFLSLSIQKNVGATLLTIPNKSTFGKIVQLANAPKKGRAATFKTIWDIIQKELGDIPVNKSYRILITNNIITGSQGLSFEDQYNVLKGMDCHMPSLLEATALHVVSIITSQFSDTAPNTYTRCSAQIKDWYVLVGNLGSDGICINGNQPTAFANVGVAAVKPL